MQQGSKQQGLPVPGNDTFDNPAQLINLLGFRDNTDKTVIYIVCHNWVCIIFA